MLFMDKESRNNNNRVALLLLEGVTVSEGVTELEEGGGECH